MSGSLNQVRFYCYDMGEVLTVYLSLTQIFQLPSVIVMSIAAARMYRNLADFVYGSTDMCFFLRFLCLLRSLFSMTCRSFESLEITDGKSTKTKQNSSAPNGTPLGQIEAALDIGCERHSTAQSIISIDGRLGDRPHGSSLGSDLESAVVNPDPR
jgi:hypothetical protein